MEFEAKVINLGTAAKPKSKIISNAFDIATKPSSATHIRIKGTKEFVPITKDLVIKKKKDSNGNPTNEKVHFSKITNDGSEFVCVRKGVESVIDGQFYTKVTFMKKSEQGSYLRCDDGCYVHKDELQVPAYKKVPVYGDVHLSKPVRNYEFFVEREVIVFGDSSNPQKITLSGDEVRRDGEYEYFIHNERIRRKDNNYEYFTDNGEWVKCKYEKGSNTRTYITHLLVNDNTVVDIKKLKEQPNGDFVVQGVNGEDIVLGKKEIKLENFILESSTLVSQGEVVIPYNIAKQVDRIENGLSLAFRWPKPDASGLKKVDVNQYRTKAVFDYGSHRVIYARYDLTIKTKPGDEVIYVNNLDIIDLGSGGVKIEFFDKVKNVAENVVFENGKPSQYEINGRKITDIKWREVGGYKSIQSYVIDGVLVSDIEEVFGEIKSCKLHLIDENGNPKIVEVDNMQSSEYKRFAINYKPIEKIENLKVSDGKISFKMGDYRFTDAEVVDGTIGKCKLRHDGKEEEINLSEDPRFKHLKMIVDITLDQSKIVPLVQSQLVEKKDGKYELVADVVQTEAMEDVKLKPDGTIAEESINKGVASAVVLHSVDQAIKQQDKFKNAPFKTIVIGANGTKHNISDVSTTYEEAANFELSNDVLVDEIGKNKFELKNGEPSLDCKKQQSRAENMIVGGLWLCSNPLTLVFGIPLLFSGIAYGMVVSATKPLKEAKIKKYKVKNFKQKAQDNTLTKCKENINKLVAEVERAAKVYKKKYSQAEYEAKVKELSEDFRFRYFQEIAKLQILSGGAIQCDFDPSKKQKLTPMVHLMYLEYLEKSTELKEGKKDSPELKSKLKTELKGLKGSQKIAKKIELLKEFGGRDSQVEAYKLQKKHIKKLLKEENDRRDRNGEDKISKKDFKKQLREEFDKGRLVWGGIEDKIEAFKNSVDYLKADKETRQKLLVEKRKSLEKEFKSIKITTMQLDERVDKNGNPIIEGEIKTLIGYMEHVDSKLQTGEISQIKKLADYKKSNKKEQVSTTSLSDAAVQRVETIEMRRVEYDRSKNAEAVQQVSVKQQEATTQVTEKQQEGERYRNLQSYEKIFELQVKLEAEEEKFKQRCQEVEASMARIPNTELNEDAVRQAESELDEIRKQYAKQKRLAEGAKKLLEQKYDRQVKSWALEEFSKFHKNEFEPYKRSRLRNNSDLSTEQIIQGFYANMCKDKDKAESYRAEFETYKVKHHVEENVDAETFCEVNQEEFEKFIAERNKKSTTGQLDPNTELARCYFYAHCKKQNSLRVDNFKRYFAKKRMNKAKERVDNNTLVAHNEKKIIKSKGAHKTAQASPAPVVAPVATVGMTA